MATTIATISLASSDLLSSALAFSQTNALTTAGTATGLTLTSGLSRTNTTYASAAAIVSTNLYRGDDATTNGANKIYLKNLSATASEFYTVYVNSEEMGRLYAGDWAFFPWSASSGTKRVFTVTIALTWAIGDTWEFDGVKIYADSATIGDVANQIHAANFPNWVTTHTADAATVVFTDRASGLGGTTVVVTGDGILNTAGNGTAAISGAAVSVESVGDIYIKPSVHTTMDLEHMLFHE
tara:strand:+ start:18 stop:734 length:717 start_codon:yes stop_codon:yes gene_type:complete